MCILLCILLCMFSCIDLSIIWMHYIDKVYNWMFGIFFCLFLCMFIALLYTNAKNAKHVNIHNKCHTFPPCRFISFSIWGRQTVDPSKSWLYSTILTVHQPFHACIMILPWGRHRMRLLWLTTHILGTAAWMCQFIIMDSLMVEWYIGSLTVQW